MKAKYLFALFSLILLHDLCAQKKIKSSKWRETILQPELKKVLREAYLYDSKTKLLYSINNDRDNIYIDLIVTEQTSIRKILQGGLTVWIDPMAKNKKNLGVQFPLAQEPPARSNQNGNNQQGNNGERPKMPTFDENMKIELIGLNGVESHFIDANTKDHINGNLSFNEYKELEYHLTIPFQKLCGVSLVNQEVSINLISGKTSMPSGGGPSGGQGGGRQGGGPPGGGGGPGGGGQGDPPGQGGGAGPSQNQGSSTAISMKFKKVLLVDH